MGMRVHDRIEALKSKHAALENAIASETNRPIPDVEQITQLKRQKLRIRDELTSIDSLHRH
jgi:hypothetical protein